MILVDGVIKPFPKNSSTLHNESNNNSGGIFSYVENILHAKNVVKRCNSQRITRTMCFANVTVEELLNLV